MRKLLIALTAVSFALVSFTSSPKYLVNTEMSTVNWRAEKVTGSSHEGTVNIKDGYFRVEDGKVILGKITADMTSIAVTDLEGAMRDKLTGHLHSADFFNTAEFKTAIFTFAKAKEAENGMFSVIGTMEIKGIKKPINMLTSIEIEDDVLKMAGTLMIDRTEFDVKYGSAKFFEGIGDRAIKDEFALTFAIQAKADG